MFIANFASYSAIGVGTENQKSSKNVAFAYDDADQIKDAKLVGVNDNGEVEEIKYSKEKDGGVEHKIKPRVVGFHSFKDYSIVMFTTVDYVNMEYGCFFVEPDGKDYFSNEYKSYIIDNRTGKFYSLEKLGKNTNNGIFYYSLDACGELYRYTSGKRIYDYFESDSAIYFCSTNHYDGDWVIDVIYKAAVENEELVVREIFSYEETGLKTDMFFVDRYDNVFLQFGLNNYLLTSDGLNTCEKFYRSVNGIAYHYVNDSKLNNVSLESVADKMVDENGNIVETDFAAKKVFLNSENKIKSTENADYYYENDELNNLYFDKIRKVTWLDDEHIAFEFEEITLDDLKHHDIQYVATNDYLYFRLSDQILKTEITTGETNVLASEYIFTKIEADNLGNVNFEGVSKNSGGKVFGLIDNNGNISVDITMAHYKIYYIKPLK